MSMPVDPPPDDRPERMRKDPDAYFAEGRAAAAEVVTQHAGRSRRNPAPIPGPGVVQIWARARTDEELQELLDRFRAAGLVFWVRGGLRRDENRVTVSRRLIVDLNDYT